VPGVQVPVALVERMHRAEAAGRAAEEGLAIAREIVADLRPMVQGLQVDAPRRNVEAVFSALDVVR